MSIYQAQILKGFDVTLDTISTPIDKRNKIKKRLQSETRWLRTKLKSDVLFNID